MSQTTSTACLAASKQGTNLHFQGYHIFDEDFNSQDIDGDEVNCLVLVVSNHHTFNRLHIMLWVLRSKLSEVFPQCSVPNVQFHLLFRPFYTCKMCIFITWTCCKSCLEGILLKCALFWLAYMTIMQHHACIPHIVVFLYFVFQMMRDWWTVSTVEFGFQVLQFTSIRGATVSLTAPWTDHVQHFIMMKQTSCVTWVIPPKCITSLIGPDIQLGTKEHIWVNIGCGNSLSAQLSLKVSTLVAVFFPRVLLYSFSHFCSFMVVWG